MTFTSSAANPTETEGGDLELPSEENLSAPALAPTHAPPALRKLVAEHLDFVWRSLRRFGVPTADVDDATQQVFLIANDKLSKIHPGSERSFLVGVATRVASHVRRSFHRREAAEQRLSVNPLEATLNPEELTQRLEARALLDRVLDAMPEELRAVFVLFELEELSIDQTAALLILPRGTVATRLRRAREVFHEQAQIVGAGIRSTKAASLGIRSTKRKVDHE
ncbi:MAG TPA: sigma-70 family RNA polymerase sigma factor [Polyangiaceae bacterium]|jgi:RNA polymerase sigma-70 factor (ECF subfamily)|nr:sigma-70 family RNA polymerase sigma factor [Polyangiaceae bacterium]